MMIHILLTILLSIHAVNCINDGTPGENEEFKYLVFIKRFNEYLCSGTIVHESYILTVGHVFTNVESSELVVFGGLVTGTYTSFTLFLVEHVYFHAQFRRMNLNDQHLTEYWENDIALLKMISWHHSIQYCGNSLTPMWHFTDILWDQHCHHWNMRLLTNEKCFIDPLRTAIMSSQDLGSPIICDNIMVGLTVRTNIDEMAERPSIFLSTFPYRDSITEIFNGGQFDAGMGEFPYVVSIWVHTNYRCGGIILDATHILSAGHCFQKRTPFRFQITFGYTSVQRFNPVMPWISHKEIKYAPAYQAIYESRSSEQRRRNDMAVVSLAEPIFWGPTIGPIDGLELVPLLPEQQCEVLHWENAENEVGEFSIKLKKSHVILLAEGTCQQLGVQPRLNEFCARSPYSVSIVDPKDSGNPIICGGKPIGIVVQTYAPPLPTIFLKLHPYTEFITEAMSAA